MDIFKDLVWERTQEVPFLSCIWLRAEPKSTARTGRYLGSPESKMFLLKLMRYLDTDVCTRAIPVRQLSSTLGVSDKVIKSSSEELQKLGLLERISEKSPLGGSTFRYRVSSNDSTDYQRAYEAHKQRTVCFPELIEELLNRESRSARHPLTLSNKLILIILLAYSDPCGVVRGLSKTEVCKLAGISLQRLRSQLNTLKDKGYISSITGGQTLAPTFGKLGSAFWLNVWHEQYEHRVGLTTELKDSVLFAVGPAKQIAQMVRSGQVKSELVALISSYFVNWRFSSEMSELITAIQKAFPFVLDSYKRDIFQAKLDEYVSACLSQYWDILDRKLEDVDELEKLIGLIERDCGFGHDIVVSEELLDESNESTPQKKTIADFLLLLTWTQAKQVYQLLEKPKLDEPCYYSFVTSKGGATFNLLSRFQADIDAVK
ncbi:hypothetical protein ACPV5S_19335 [Vibrio astriarenae]